MLPGPADKANQDNHGVPAEVVERLFPAAIRLFAERDFHAVGMRDIAAASGVSTATMYKYFHAKEALLFAILRRELSAIDVDLRKAVAQARSAEEQWRACFRELMRHYDANPDIATVYFITVPTRTWISEGSWASFGSADFLQGLAACQQAAGRIDRAITPSMAASLVFMLCAREVQLWFYRGKSWRLTDRADRMTALFWKTVSL